MNVDSVQQVRMSEGRELQFVAVVTEKARHARLVCVPGTVSIRASDDHRGQTGTAAWMRSLRFTGVEDDCASNVSNAVS